MATDSLKIAEMEEGQTVTMHINPHSREVCPSKVTGTVVEYPDRDRDLIRKHGPSGVMCDIVVETPEGDRFRYYLDNGYVSGYHPDLDRRTDIGRFRRFTAPDA